MEHNNEVDKKADANNNKPEYIENDIENNKDNNKIENNDNPEYIENDIE